MDANVDVGAGANVLCCVEISFGAGRRSKATAAATANNLSVQYCG